MNYKACIAAAIGYVPVVGWVLAPVIGRGNAFVRFHLRQSVGVIGFIAAVALGWALLSFLAVAVIPYGFVIANFLFALVVAALIFAVIAWVGGLINAARGRAALLPIFGATANRLPL